MSTAQGFPQISGPLVDADGRLMPQWYYFLQNLWNRTGQALARDTDFRFFNAGVPGAGAVNMQLLTESVTFETSFAGGYAFALAAATAATLITINKVSAGVVTKIGEVNFAAGATSGTLSSVSASNFNVLAGEALELVYPNPADATLADIAISFTGSHIV